MSRRARIAVILGLAAATAVLAVSPRPFSTPIYRVANYKSNGADPIWDARPPVDGTAFRRAARLLPPRAYLYIYGPGDQYQHDLLGAAVLYFAPVFPVADPKLAHWVLSYQEPTLLPHGLRALRSWPLGDRIFLVSVRPT